MQRSGQRMSVAAPSVGMTSAAGRLSLPSRSTRQWLTTMQAAGLTDLRSTRGTQESAGAGAENSQIRGDRLEGPAWEREGRRREASYRTAH